MEALHDFLNQILIKHEYVSSAVTLEAKLKEDLGLDSLAILTIADEIEEEFDISLEAEDLSEVPKTVSDLLNLIQKRKG